MTKIIICKECGEPIFFIRTQSGAKMPVNKKQIPFICGGKNRVVTPQGDVVAATILDRSCPESVLGFIPHCQPARMQIDSGLQRKTKKRTLFEKKACFKNFFSER